MCREAGFRYPLAMTAAVFHDCVSPLGEDEELAPTQDVKGRLWDVLLMMRQALHSGPQSDMTMFEVHVVPNCKAGEAEWSPPQVKQLWATCGPLSATDPQPVITIYYPHER